ncbi:antitoxin Xre/MbcA/ParS toxin-binding domain-containing protein [Brumicola pallidula]|uniref:Antitoxin Xre/MbcA/ParS-like toxin-binding domain-containing protein n=1 Tax=Brumicola pallidula DSM 14239 = ACAM 615 TaxID=1121922 RepID=K6Y516_9ALTE|nr:antitoxin Xre/MbcA/ParS toxin-binding domain-containing protein [Glaciecola pallidula]GAC27869.1 hypothetical protein GPAL_0990 [Glaciecola pallidula DSM 14239 = ACAM 615]
MPQANTDTSRVGLNLFFYIMNAWAQPQVAQMKLLGITDLDTFEKLANNELTDISEESLVRISYLMKIHKYLRTIFSQEEQADGWVNRANTEFNDLTASEYIQLNGTEGLEKVCKYLHSYCH